ncbi:MAG: PilZ domain-containing protein [Planctomycetota bacterium]|nr:PilZ domain-containing protein [Planctomycetota bacterium]
MDVNIETDWKAAQQTRELLLARSGRNIFDTGRRLRQSLIGGNRVFVYGRGTLALIAEYCSRLFLSGGVTGHGQQFPMLALTTIRDLEIVGHEGETVIWLNYATVDNLEAKNIVDARARGVKVFVIGSSDGDFLETITDHQILIPSRHQVVLTELTLSILHSLYKVVSETEEIESSIAQTSAPASAPSIKFWGPTGDPTPKTEVYNPLGEAPVKEPEKTPSTSIRRPSTATASVKRQRSKGATRSSHNIKAGDARGRTSSVKTLRFRCGSCSEVITVDRRYMGKKGQCPFCLEQFSIPASKTPSQANEVLVDIDGKGKRPERRRSHRFEVTDAKALFKLTGGWHEKGELIEDVSLTGVGVRLLQRDADDFQQGSELVMALDFPAFMEPLRVNGRLRRIEEDEEGIHLGIEFTEFKKDSEKKLRRLVQNVALRGIRRS